MSRILSVLAVLGVMVGCAAQDSHREYYRAERLLEEAQQKSPSHRDVRKAEASLLKGKSYLDDAIYDKASQNFKESIRLSEGVVNPQKREKAPPVVAVESTPAPAVSAAPAPEVSAPAPRMVTPPTRGLKPDEARILPRDALAKYLSSKRAETKSEKRTPSPTAAPAPSAAPAPAPVKETPMPAQKAEQPSDDGKVFAVDPDLAPAEKKDVKPPAEVVKAPAKPIDKFLPSTPRPQVQKQVVEVPSRPTTQVGTGPATDKPRTKIPGALFFSQNDASIEPETMMTLDQTSKFLLENPSTSVIFQGISGPGESGSLIDSRFESLRSYLVGKGVPEDQVRLDTKRRGGSRAEFEMFLIEH